MRSDTDTETQPTKTPAVAYYKLVRTLKLSKFSRCFEGILIFIGVLLSLGSGVVVGMNLIILGNVFDSFAQTHPKVLWHNIAVASIKFVVLAAINFVAAWISNSSMGYVAASQTLQIRLKFYQAIMRKEIGWFDANSTGNLITLMSSNSNKIEKGIGTELPVFLQSIAIFIASISLGFFYNWKLALFSLASLPFLLGGMMIIGICMIRYTRLETSSYSKAGSIAGEVLRSIRTVTAFGTQKFESDRYARPLELVRFIGIQKSTMLGLTTGFFTSVIFSSFALCFWYGIKLMLDNHSKPGDVIVVVLGVVTGSLSLGRALPGMRYFYEAKAAAYEIFQIIDQPTKIDRCDANGRIKTIEGSIQFNSVSFRYPTRSDVPVMENFNLHVKPGSKVALIGPSGGGKSTCINLIQRFYDPLEGQIMIDGLDLRSYRLDELRKQIGLVTQEPVLFAGTIKENIRHGYQDASESDILEAAKLANAHDFILEQPKGYDTWISEGGGMLSGGQKQRIAIARALVRKPKILLLDEATSALDTRSEKIVQLALDRACADRTVLLIAHRLSTVRDADEIVVVSAGHIVEQGNHDQLLTLNGVYAQMLVRRPLNIYHDARICNEINCSSFHRRLVLVLKARRKLRENKSSNK
ncbi:hypothetical protein Ciccas_000554 [Cichlidogyrus casuarinus]|uniref:Uncharacterized protein n=1 Tax=Cichlidogyrus casuarinus TaxID=1844966 RepID=A0ABD2QMP6_9PLAT